MSVFSEILSGFLIAIFAAAILYFIASYATAHMYDYSENGLSEALELTEESQKIIAEIEKQKNLFDSNFSCPDCECTASCSSKAKQVEGCHVPKRYLKRNYKIMDYTGYSNIPSIFAGNTLRVTDLTNPLFPGCFYVFDYGGELVVHRLLGNYENHVVFRGDNNDEFENVRYSDIKHLVIGIDFT